ncbi:hypothetical protein SSP35_04_04560 [Streptomyces sp. NBRC 110611]|uniref:DUF4034 domain-containing protein n=1 Tax=Streptomyces sp. NBRC 110611 TaxID=1621259 RepID=UPI0008567B48|nr:DUF4034 domain-containing protein [Streptomyces sp. NBRC 110611]GAU67368.1 hypothetical protein SSP35_04_04560 [Streptomyces sp. NBRC 110611]
MHGILPLTILALTVVFWLRSRRRTAKLAAEAGGDLLPPERQNADLAFPDPEAEAVSAALARGEWQPAAQALAAAGTDWERRSYLVGIIANRAADDDTWLRAWQAAHPDDPDAAVVQADAKVSLAWEIRGGGWAKDTTAEQFAGFHRVLDEAREDFARAQALALPGDPTPYLLQIPLYMGLGAPHEALHELWSEVTARAPYHYEAHWYALQYWLPKWRGSAELARDFTLRAATTAPLGNLLTMFPLLNWYEQNDDEAPEAAYGWPEMTGLIDAALADVAAARPDHPRLAEVRHLLAYCLTKAERHQEAMEQFRQVDGYVDAVPWRYYTNPAKIYCHFRDQALKGTVRTR